MKCKPGRISALTPFLRLGADKIIFAELTERPNVDKLLEILKNKFGDVEWADQGTDEDPDAYFWIKRRGVTVAVDNLTSFEFQNKCAQAGTPQIQEVIDALSGIFSVKIYDEPEQEAHE